MTGLAYRSDGARLATVGLDEKMRVWNTKTQKMVPKPEPQGYQWRIDQAVFSPDGRLITANMGIGASLDPKSGTARIIDLASEKVRELNGHTGTVMGAAYSPDGKTIATSGFDRTVRLWDAESGDALGVGYGHEAHIGHVIFSSRGSYLATDANDGTGMIVDANAQSRCFVFRD